MNRVVRRTVGVEKMIDEPSVVEAQLLREPELCEHLIPALVRLAEEQAEADGKGGTGRTRSDLGLLGDSAGRS